MAALETVGFLEIEQQKICLIGRRIYLVGYNRKMTGPYFILLKGDSVDKKHAVIDVTPKAVSLVDLNSETGTYINGRRLKPLFKYIINSGDKIRFGNVIGKVQINATEDDNMRNVDSTKSPDKSDVIFSSPEPDSVFQKPKIPIITEIKNVFKTRVSYENINNTKRESLNIPETQPRMSDISSATYDDDYDDEFCVPETQEVVTAVCNFKRNVSEASGNPDDIDFRIGTQDYFEDAAEQSACSQASMIIPQSEYLIREDLLLIDGNDQYTPTNTNLNTNLLESTTPPPSCSPSENTSEKETIKDRAAACCTPDIFDCPQIDYPTAYNRSAKKNRTPRSLTPVDGHEKRNNCVYEEKVPMQQPDFIYQLMKTNVTQELLNREQMLPRIFEQSKQNSNQDLTPPTQPNIAIQQLIVPQDQINSPVMEKVRNQCPITDLDTNQFAPTQPTLTGSALPVYIKPNIITPPYDDDRTLPVTQFLLPQQLDILPTQPAPLPEDISPTTVHSKWKSITTTVLADADSMDNNNTPTKSDGHNSTMKNDGNEKTQNVAAFFAEIKDKTAKRKIEADGSQSPVLEYSQLTEMFQTPKIIKENFSKDLDQIRQQNKEAREKVLQYDNSDDEEERSEVEEDTVKFFGQRKSKDFNVLMRANNSIEKAKLKRNLAENATKDEKTKDKEKNLSPSNETVDNKSISVVSNEKSQHQESENNNIPRRLRSKSIEVPNISKKSSENDKKAERSLKTNLSPNMSKKRSKSAPDIEENIAKTKKKSNDPIQKIVQKPRTTKGIKEKHLKKKFKEPSVRLKKLPSKIVENNSKEPSKSIIKASDSNIKQTKATTPPELSKNTISGDKSISINSHVITSDISRNDESILSIDKTTGRKGRRIRVDAIEKVVKVEKLISESREMPMRRTTRLQSARETAADNTGEKLHKIKEINETLTKQKQTVASVKLEEVENNVDVAIAKMNTNVEIKMDEKIDNKDVGTTTKTKETRKRSAETLNETSKKKRTESKTGSKTETVKKTDSSRNAIRKSIMEDIIEISNESELSDLAMKVKEPKTRITFEDATKNTSDGRRQCATSPNANVLPKAINKNNLKVATTMVDPKILKTLSVAATKAAWQLTKDPTQADVLVMDKGNRTYKFLVAIARGIPIVNSNWLGYFTKTGSLPSITKFVFNDPNFEKRHRFQLLKTIDMARKKKIFTGLTFLMTPSIQPQPDEMKKIISIAGGNVQPQNVDALKESQKVYLISSMEDKKLWAKYRRINSQIRIITTEGVMGSIMRQVLQPLSDHMLC